MKRTFVLVGASVGALLLLSACSAGTGTAGSTATATSHAALQFSSAEVAELGGQKAVDQMSKFYDAASSSGKTTVTIYGSSELNRAPVYAAFEKRFPGITVKSSFVPNELSKLQQEFASGKQTVDMLQDGDAISAYLASQNKYEKFTPVLAASLPPQFTDGKGYLAAATAGGMGIAYNEDKVPAKDAPTSWHDLADPKWKGKIVMFPAGVAGPTASTLTQMQWDGRFTTEFVKKLAANDPGKVDTVPAIGTSVASGEYPLGPFYSYSFYKKAVAGGKSPLKFAFPLKDGNRFTPMYIGVLKGGPSPDAARLLEAWMFTPEAQKAVAGVGDWGTVPGAPGPSPYPSLDKIDALKPVPLDTVGSLGTQRVKEYVALFGG